MNLPLRQSPLLISQDDAALLIIDVQEKLIPAIAGNDQVVWNVKRLLKGGRLFQVPLHVTEQYPQGLGSTLASLTNEMEQPHRYEKQAFSACGCEGLLSWCAERGKHQLIVAGIEAHVCVMQTVLDAIAEGYQVYAVTDAIGSRHSHDYEMALRRMETSGAYLTTTEAVLFEWCRTASDALFKQVSELIRAEGPN